MDTWKLAEEENLMLFLHLMLPAQPLADGLESGLVLD